MIDSTVSVAPAEQRLHNQVPLAVSFNGAKDGPLFQMKAPEGNGNPLFWRTISDSFRFTAADMKTDVHARAMVRNLASVAATLHAPTSGDEVMTHVRPSVDESCKAVLGEYDPSGPDSWKLAVASAVTALNRGYELPKAQMEAVVREFHAILTGGSFHLKMPDHFEAQFHQLSQNILTNTGDLIEGLGNVEKQDPRMLLVTNAMVLAYAKSMHALTANY